MIPNTEKSVICVELIEAQGVKALVIDVATGPDPSKGYDISREEVAESAGVSWQDMESKSKGEKISFIDRGRAICGKNLSGKKG